MKPLAPPKARGAGPRIDYRGNEATRFWEKMKIAKTGCWEWQGTKEKGYGRFTLARRFSFDKTRFVFAHRWAYQFCFGEVPKGHDIHHKCNNPSCVNPLHLEAVTPKQHVFLSPKTLASTNASKLFCVRGHPLSGENCRITKGHRYCKICQRDLLTSRRILKGNARSRMQKSFMAIRSQSQRSEIAKKGWATRQLEQAVTGQLAEATI